MTHLSSIQSRKKEMRNNMKSFLFTVLLLCSLHVQKSSAPNPLVDVLSKFLYKLKPSKIKLDRPPVKSNKQRRSRRDVLNLPPPPPPPPSNPDTPEPPPSIPNTPEPPPSDHDGSDQPPPQSPPVKIKGLSILKEYLDDYGYMTNSTYPFSDILDTETISAIHTYQNFFNIDSTSLLDNQTLTQMLLPRCVVPDLNINYDLNSETNVSWPQGIRWFPNGTSTNNLTYGFLPESKIPLHFQSVFTDAFNRWSKAIAELNLANLTFTETDYNTADIKIGFYFLNNTDEDVVAGTIIRYEDDSNNGNGNKIVVDIGLDASSYWVLPGYNGTWSSLDGDFDLGTVAMHQIGHILGLSHSSNAESIMYPSISTTNDIKVEITDDDKNNILKVYKEVSSTTISGSGGHYFTPFWSCALILTNFSLQFILLLY